MSFRRWAICLSALSVGTLAVARAEDSKAADEPVEPAMVFESVTVTGGAARVESIPGSATFIGPEELEEQGHSDLQRILQQVPGVNIQDEDGYGLRPNIGMRGTGVERSSKITLLEDGVLIAPAPYAAPAAYYVPTAGRMEAVEVRKGSSAVVQGPYTNGGVINLVSRGIPNGLAFQAQLAAGDNDTTRLDADVGGSGERFGWLLETYQLETDGFKDLDGGGSTGFDLEDHLGKLRFGSKSDARIPQLAELKIGLTRQFGDETYLGLTRDDYRQTPFRRYAGSQQDYLDSEHKQYLLRYFIQPASRLRFTATTYRNDFSRNWHKGQSVAGVGLSALVDSPELYPTELGIVRGEIDDLTGAIRVRNNRRDYSSQGVEVIGELDLETGSVDHALKFGVRVHTDEEDRFQEEDTWNMVDGVMQGEIRGVPGSQSNRISSADATAFYVRDEIRLGRWSLSPGVRFEGIDFQRADFGTADPNRTGTDLAISENRVSEVLPGMGVSYQLSGAWGLFGGLHKGFAPPGPGQSEEVDNEESLNYEAGFNYRGGNLGARVIGFFSNYDNLLGRDTLSSAGDGTGDAFNGGAVDVQGLEVVIDYDLGIASQLSASVPLRVAYTYTDTEFKSGFETSFADWQPEVMRGDELPYIPQHQLTVSLGYVRDRWASHLNLNYNDSMRTRPGQGEILSGTEIEARLVADLAADFQIHDRIRLFAQVRNLADETYLVARRPHGARPGLPRTVLLGIDWSFGR